MLDKKVLEKFNKEQEKLIGIIVRKDSLIAGVTYEKLLESLEKETVYLRQLISMCSSGFNEQCNLPDNKYEISVKSEQYSGKRRYILELPFLLPNRRSSKTNFKRTIVSDTHHSILEYCKKVHPKMIRNASVTFINYYAPSVHRKLRHDNDNTEVSAVLNTLTGFFIPDDNSLCCDLHIISREGEKSYTKVIVEERIDENEQK